MAGAMRKMAVYLGLVEDDVYEYDDYDEDDIGQDGRDRVERTDRREERRDERREEPREVREPRGESRERREDLVRGATALREAGALRDEGRLEEHRATVSAMPERRPESSTPVTVHKVVSEREPYRITTLHPRTYNEARTIGEHFRESTPVIMNLTEMEDTDAKRLVDFAAGLVFGLHGSIERVTQKVFLLSPANVDVTAEDKARIAEGGFFNQS
ncbi:MULTISPECIES: cell division protein SepF [Embleya]|jgi:cell division inhibitor SepF|uniref:cell division protein SepF n=1 Tax=Embleya TaxID=2699295 RepID=UPI00039CD419|nr:cell division protein SepF [Embleya scabrispora]MYS87018.1 cell division protein SepF [Streptomyces sp. SID5474]WSY39087.1 cell division protein SepF [Embleya sp. NBC_00888]